MREIKFRGLGYDGKWHYGYYAVIPSDGGNGGFIFEDDEWIEARSETVGQFTGLHDKNGKDAYEGDIVNCSCGCPHEVIFGGKNGMPGWWLKGTSVGPMGDYEWTGEEEVIGNKFETPELLK